MNSPAFFLLRHSPLFPSPHHAFFSPKVSHNIAGIEGEPPQPDLLVLDLSASWVEAIELTPKVSVLLLTYLHAW